jgi:pimeloyl-ACP methyl ester carboxylesterase
VELHGRGTTFVRDVDGPPGAPTVLLLHGWLASGALNWFHVFEPLAEQFRVVAPDLRGHARGLRSRRVFRLADCADDAAETLLELDCGPAVVVGYSMGGPVAQLFWRRHRDLCRGLVLCATAAGFVPGARERLAFQAMMTAAVGAARMAAISGRLSAPIPVAAPRGFRTSALPEWARGDLRRHDLRMVVEAGHSLATFHSGRWLPEVDVPTEVLLTARDETVTPGLQRRMARAIPHARVREIRDDHLACARPEFAPELVQACIDVANRANEG